MKIKNLDHLVLTVRDLSSTIDFYKLLGMDLVDFKGRKALKFGNQKINLHEATKEFEPKAETPTPGSADLCFIVETRLEQVMDELIENGIQIIEGPVERTGAVYSIRSVYVRDPDQNLIELSNPIPMM